MNKFLKITSVITLLLFLRASFALAADQVYYYYTDPAGTPLVMSDSTGTVVWQADYLPFGEETIDTSTVPNNKMFVGKEKDSESGLYYFGARYMDSTAGRFTAPDSIGPINQMTGKINDSILWNPQRLNVYAYSLNNPYRFIDPDGRIVLVTSHYIVAPFRHSALLLIPNDQSINWGQMGFVRNKEGQWSTTLSAGPVDGVLKSGRNRSTDAPDNNRIDGVVNNPYGGDDASDTKFILNLMTADWNYGDNVTYSLAPGGSSVSADARNSNSYVSGLVNYTGATMPQMDGIYPGMGYPLGPNNFEPPNLQQR